MKLVSSNTSNLTSVDKDLSDFLGDGYTLLQFFRSAALLAMSAGYSLVECGSIRSQNAVHSLFKLVLFISIASLCFWSVGYAFAFGVPGNGMLGHGFWFSKDINEASRIATMNEHFDRMSHVFFHAIIAILVVISSSTSFAERLKVHGEVIYCVVMTGLVYPIVCHWMWSSVGWLHRLGATDSCGSAVIFLTSGVAGLVGTWFLGPRHGRFIPRLLPLFGHNMPIQTLGHALIFCGFLSLNCCANSQNGIIDLTSIGRGAYNTVIAGSISGLEYYVLTNFWLWYGGRLKRRIHLSISNAVLAGMVSVSSGAPFYEPWSAFFSGALVLPFYIALSKAISRLSIDDPADLCAAHISGGMIGTLLVSGLKILSGRQHFVTMGQFAIREVQSGWWILLWNACALGAIVIWTASFIFLTFLLMSVFNNYRFSFEDEIKGVDLYRYGEPAYALRIYCASCGEQLQSRVIDSSSICNGNENKEDFLISARNKHTSTHPQTTIITDAEGAIVPIECLTDRSDSQCND